MGGVQAKLSETEKQVEKARKESATAREAFNTVRKQRYAARQRLSGSSWSRRADGRRPLHPT